MRTKFNNSIPIQNNQRTDKYKNVPKTYMQIAEGMESQFNQLLINQMKKTVDRANPNSPASKLYEQLLDEQYSDIMSQSESGSWELFQENTS